jgi:hypothetical protein
VRRSFGDGAFGGNFTGDGFQFRFHGNLSVRLNGVAILQKRIIVASANALTLNSSRSRRLEASAPSVRLAHLPFPQRGQLQI